MKQCLTTSRDNGYEKSFRDPQLCAKLGCLHFLMPFSLASIIFIDIAQDCSLGHCLKSGGAETSKKDFCGPVWGGNDLFYSNGVERPLKLVCCSGN